MCTVRTHCGAQTGDDIATVIMEQVIAVDEPPLRVQTNPSMQPVFDMQLGDTTGEAGVAAGAQRFLSGV